MRRLALPVAQTVLLIIVAALLILVLLPVATTGTLGR